MTAPRSRGFTLIEVALSIVVLAVLLGAMILPLQTQLETRMLDDAQRVLEEAREALIGYVLANGHFPCPATAASGGYEPPEGDPDIGINPGETNRDTGECGAGYVGFLPAATLGMTSVDASGFAVDPWGGATARIRYAISSATVDGVDRPLTSEGGIAGVNMELLMGANLLSVCASGVPVVAGTSCGPAANAITTNAAAVIWSLGPNGATGGTSVHELENVNGDRIFVSRPRSTVAGNEFDDLVTWVPTPILIARMVAAGHLP